MQSKTRELAILHEQTAKRVTNSLANWAGFLAIVGNLYKYPCKTFLNESYSL